MKKIEKTHSKELPPLPEKRRQPDPISDAEFVLLEAKKLREHWFVDGAWQNLSGAALVFFKEHFEHIFDSPDESIFNDNIRRFKLAVNSSAEASSFFDQIKALWKSAPSDLYETLDKLSRSSAVNYAVGYSCYATSALKENDEPAAWMYIARASYWIGIAKGASTTHDKIAGHARKDYFFAPKSLGAAMAKLRHAENYALADDALKFWRDNISPTLSAQKAADELIKVVPLSHKKLAELVSAEKNKVSRLRKPEPKR